LIDGAIGAIEDTTEFVPIDLEAPLDFDSAGPLIYPQKLVLFQEDDEYYESTGNFNGFWNSKSDLSGFPIKNRANFSSLP
jgi:tripeptidyl-peptidase-1